MYFNLISSFLLFTNVWALVPQMTRMAVNSGQNCGCYPALGFTTPATPPTDLTGWWCDSKTEYAFLGFSYGISACQSRDQLIREFSDIRNNFNSRYVRLYGACDRDGFYDDIVEAAWVNSLGVHALIWFGFNGDNTWMRRRDTLFRVLHSNPKAKFVTRVVQFGSEPLYDNVISAEQLREQVIAAKANLLPLGIPVTVSELAYGYQERRGAQEVLDAVDSINVHVLPFFSSQASTAKDSWNLVLSTLDWIIEHGKGKKIYFDEVCFSGCSPVLFITPPQNGWPSATHQGIRPNTPNAIADVQNEDDYFSLLDRHCKDLKAVVGGGVGWFAHIYSDDQDPGYGIYDLSGKKKFRFKPRTQC